MAAQNRKRKTNTTVACPIVYGSIAFYLGKKADQHATHRWTLFVRGPNDEDLSVFIQKVAFTLHPSFLEPVREVLQPPFEVSETGWGEFEAGIRIYFRDPEEQPVDLFQLIRLYPEGTQQLNAKRPVMSESYDEIVFTNPTEAFFSCLMSYCPTGMTIGGNGTNNSSGGDIKEEGKGGQQQQLQSSSGGGGGGGVNHKAPKSAAAISQQSISAFSEYYTVFDESADLEVLTAIHDHIRREIEEAKNKLVYLDSSTVDAQHKSFLAQSQQQATQQQQTQQTQLQQQQQMQQQMQQQQQHAQQQHQTEQQVQQQTPVPLQQLSPQQQHQHQQSQQQQQQYHFQPQLQPLPPGMHGMQDSNTVALPMVMSTK